MEWVPISLAILSAAGGIVYYYHRFYERFVQKRLLQEKQLAIYEEIVCLISKVKATLEYTSGDETLREWRVALMQPLREMLEKSYQWSIFLPENINNLPSEYAGKVAHSVARLETVPTQDVEKIANVIVEIKTVENKAAQELQHKIRQSIGASD